MTFPYRFILFTDLVGSAQDAIRDPVGEAGRRLAMIEATREALAEAKGRVVQDTGDGFLCLAPTLGAALRAGERIIRTVNSSEGKIRVAIHYCEDLHLRSYDPGEVTAESIERERTPAFVYFDNEGYPEVARTARLLGVTCDDQILATEWAYRAERTAVPQDRWKSDHPTLNLKDFGEPEKVHEVLWSGASKGRPKSPYLPEFYTRRGGLYVERPAMQKRVLVGLARGAAQDAAAPITAILGDGGMDKTRLAEEVALRVAGLYRRAAWISVANDVITPDEAERLCASGYTMERARRLPDLANVLRLRLADRLGFAGMEEAVKRHREVPAAFTECLERYAREFPRVLLVLDNWEPLNARRDDPPGTEACNEVLIELTQRGVEWTLLVTSRDRPHLASAMDEVNVDDGLEEGEAVRLFGLRWQGFGGTTPDEGDVRAVAAACDRIPLAIELAASVRLSNAFVTVREIAEKVEKLTALWLATSQVLPDDPGADAATPRFRRASGSPTTFSLKRSSASSARRPCSRRAGVPRWATSCCPTTAPGRHPSSGQPVFAGRTPRTGRSTSRCTGRRASSPENCS